MRFLPCILQRTAASSAGPARFIIWVMGSPTLRCLSGSTRTWLCVRFAHAYVSVRKSRLGPSTFDSVGETFPKKRRSPLSLTCARSIRRSASKPTARNPVRYPERATPSISMLAACSSTLSSGHTPGLPLRFQDAGILKIIPDDGGGGTDNDIATKTEDLDKSKLSSRR